MPVIGKILKQTELSNYMRILSLLIGSGVQITEALIISAKVSSNQTIVNASLEASRYVEKGSNLSDYFRSNKFFDPIISSMVKIGEETGKVDELLSKVAENYSNESGYAIKGLSSAIEPIILIVLGISVGGIILSVITPIYSIIGTVGGL
jgi:type IV pilus assembly protein PilC